MLIVLRALVYATLFVGTLLFLVPFQILHWSGAARPLAFGAWQWAGFAVGLAGLGLALSCVLTFAVVGKGTPAPFDPPRRLVIRGPYRHVRNPMYVGAGGLLIGLALIHGSWWIMAYLCVLWLVVHLLVVFYEEPTLRRMFGQEYEDYTKRVPRWFPSWTQSPGGPAM